MRQIVRQRILNKFNNQCVICGSKERLEVDHIIPLSLGGREDENNMQILCKPCNLKKHNKPLYKGVFKLDDNYKEYILLNRELALEIMCSGSKEAKVFLNYMSDVVEHPEKYLSIYGVSNNG